MTEEIENWIMKILDFEHDSSAILAILTKKGYSEDDIMQSFDNLINSNKIKERLKRDGYDRYLGELGYYDKVI